MAISQIHLILVERSILGPLLFCTSIYINDLPNVLVHSNIHMYADNVQIYSRTPKENIDSCLHYINRDLVRVDDWGSANGICINPLKSKCIIL